ncbi:MAG: cupin domain-containing protein [Caldilineaceae bacterium]|nr:cupin domain-containing protein [Caldilineaceae bacterium]
MPFDIYDFRADHRNVLVTPEIRARIYRMAPGQVDSRHSHDLGHEVFLILEGRAEFTIDGDTHILEAGQMCIALSDQIHQVRNLLPDQPTIMYLSVTPHIHPTHTDRNEDGSAQPPHFPPNQNYDLARADEIPLADLIHAQVNAARTVAEAAQLNLRTQQQMATALLTALIQHDQEAAIAARNRMWEAIYHLHKAVYAFDQLWNDFAPRAVQEP